MGLIITFLLTFRFLPPDYSTCIKENVLSFLDAQGIPESSRTMNEVDSDVSGEPESLDEKILARVRRYLLSHQFVIESPEYMKDAAIVYKPAQDPADFDVVYKTAEEGEQGRLRGIWLGRDGRKSQSQNVLT